MGKLGDWDKDVPSANSFVKDGDDLIRSDKSILENTLEQEHYFTSSTNSTGEHKHGSARPYYEAASAISAAADDARLMVASDTSDLHYVGSDGPVSLTEAYDVRSPAFRVTAVAGSELLNETWQCSTAGSDDTSVVWVNNHVIAPQNSAGNALGIIYDGLPIVQISAFTDTAVPVFASIYSVTDTMVWSVTSKIGAAVPNDIGLVISSWGTISRSSLS